MTPSSAQRWLRAKLGPHVRVIARDGKVRIVHDEHGAKTLLASAPTIEAAIRQLTDAAAEIVGASTAVQVRATVRSPWQAFVLAFRMFFATLFGVRAK